jgi:enoyl-CoA hydratase/carnithine racemase
MSVSVEDVGNAAVVTLGWVDRRNALGPAEARMVAEAIDQAGASDASTVILTGTGAFCAGGDLRRFAELSAALDVSEIRAHVYGHVQAMVRALRRAPVPTIAAVDGPAVGLGMDLALACDMRFVGPDGWLQQGWGRAGLISATGGTAFLERTARGSVWALLADQPRLDQARCRELGLGELGLPTAREAALARTESLASVPRDVLSAYAEIARDGVWPDDEYLERCADLQARLIGSQRFRDLATRLLDEAEGRGRAR